jgi:proline dehydrogenase
MRRLWQAGMIALARSPRAKAWAQASRAGTALATRYVAGTAAAEAVATATAMLAGKGLRASLFYLGEYIDTADLVSQNVAAILGIVSALGRARLDVHVSVDPTQIGHVLDPQAARRHAFAIAEAVARASHGHPGLHALMLDMEDESVIDATLALHDEIRVAGLPVAVTLQAYLRRTESDLQARLAQGATVRLVKGAFAAGSDIAHTSRHEIKAASRRLIDLMLGHDARAAGFTPIVATHDDALQAYTSARAAKAGWRKGLDYEFEMLLGVRGDLAAAQAASGERVRLYFPFGRDWWPHALRRIGENPANGWLLARSVAGR